MTSLIVGVTGRKRSGKDTFARRLVEQHGFTRLAFADTLKTVMVELNPVVPVEAAEVLTLFGPDAFGRRGHHRLAQLVAEVGWEKAKEVREVRRLLQVHGVAIRKQVNPDIWVDTVRRKAANLDGPVIITDVRFPNEAAYIADVGGQLVRVERGGLDRSDTHISETALDDWPVDITIPNGGTVSDLHRLADLFANALPMQV